VKVGPAQVQLHLVGMTQRVPWTTHQEFFSVYGQLKTFLPILDAKLNGGVVVEEGKILDAVSVATGGVLSVAVWRKRSPFRLPHAIETTCKLSEAVLCDVNGSVSNDALCSLYSMAILRGVNGLADSANQKSSTASSVASLTSSLGLPTWLADLRHDVSHNDLPELGCLRLGAARLLSFLFLRYWDEKRDAVLDKLRAAHSTLVSYKALSKQLGVDKRALLAITGKCFLFCFNDVLLPCP